LTEKLTIRKAESDDVDLLYNWSNDQLVREQSFTSDVIPYDTHCDWFRNKLISNESLIFIVEMEGVPAGIVRFESDNETTSIGISIDKLFRGKGLGSETIKIGVNQYFKEKNLPILASIKKDNIPSIKSFEKAGFSYLKQQEINAVEGVVYQLKKS
jgi:RimJ/RimL family protein N-acetyltransferase